MTSCPGQLLLWRTFSSQSSGTAVPLNVVPLFLDYELMIYMFLCLVLKRSLFSKSLCDSLLVLTFPLRKPSYSICF